jgi:hypothetical protein
MKDAGKVENKEVIHCRDWHGEKVAGHYAKDRKDETTIIEDWTNVEE